jgi:serine/threonine-protein phosphatase 2A regulatory subunit B
MEQRVPKASRLSSFEFRYMTEFQSHEPEFDYLKSFEIEEKINKVRWVNHSSSSRLVLSTNDKTIKLWKVSRHCLCCTPICRRLQSVFILPLPWNRTANHVQVMMNVGL